MDLAKANSVEELQGRIGFLAERLNVSKQRHTSCLTQKLETQLNETKRKLAQVQRAAEDNLETKTASTRKMLKVEQQEYELMLEDLLIGGKAEKEQRMKEIQDKQNRIEALEEQMKGLENEKLLEEQLKIQHQVEHELVKSVRNKNMPKAWELFDTTSKTGSAVEELQMRRHGGTDKWISRSVRGTDKEDLTWQCVWKKEDGLYCGHSSNKRPNVSAHIKQRHFGK